MKAELYNEYQKLIDETNQYRNNGSRIKDVKKLRFLAIMKAAEQSEATPRSLRVLANENFRKYVVEIVYIDAVLDKNRQRRESREFFERNIFTRGMEISASPILTDNLVNALTPEKINSYMTKITGFATEKVYTRDIILQTRQEREQRQSSNPDAMLFEKALAAFRKVYNQTSQSANSSTNALQVREQSYQYIQLIAAFSRFFVFVCKKILSFWVKIIY